MSRPVAPRTQTREQKKTAALQMLTLRRSLDDVRPDDLVRSYGLSLPDAQAMIEGERLRRSEWR